VERRQCLRGAGVVTVAVVGGGVWRAYDQGVFGAGQGPAYEPWKDRRNNSDKGTIALVRAAILAASPHNTQPWLFKVTNSSIELYLVSADLKGSQSRPVLNEPEGWQAGAGAHGCVGRREQAVTIPSFLPTRSMVRSWALLPRRPLEA
jgi:hypothetical protein